jgi:hypothetical protein
MMKAVLPVRPELSGSRACCGGAMSNHFQVPGCWAINRQVAQTRGENNLNSVRLAGSGNDVAKPRVAHGRDRLLITSNRVFVPKSRVPLHKRNQSQGVARTLRTAMVLPAVPRGFLPKLE